MKKNNDPVRGTKDYLPQEMEIREQVKSKIISSYKKFGYNHIEAPIIEDINNLLGSDGGDNLKLIFKILKRGEKLDLTKPNLTERDIVDSGLRYDLTVPLVRLFSNNQDKLIVPFKSIQIGYSFRAERPQRGRDRQFIQCDIDILGDPTCNAEIDILNTTGKTYLDLGFKNFEIKINDRRILNALIVNCGFNIDDVPKVCISLDKLDKMSIENVKAEIIENGFEKSKCENLISAIEDILKNGIKALNKYHIPGTLIENLTNIINSVNNLSENKYNCKFCINIVRGQGYYTGTVYEVYLNGLDRACGGGGRYDNMIEKMTGKSMPAVGFSIGFEPTCLLIKEQNLLGTEKTQKTAVIYNDSANFIEVLKVVEKLNKTGVACAMLEKKNFKFQLQSLKANGYTAYIVFGKDKIVNL